MLGIVFLCCPQFAFFAVESFQHALRVVDRLFLAAEIGHGLDETSFEFLPPGLGALFLFLEARALDGEALQHRRAHRFLLAKCRQFVAKVVAMA